MGPAELCERLDELLLRLMDELESLQGKREALNQHIEKGWLCLSQARYSMGNKSVSSLNYSPHMSPLTLLHCRSAQEGHTCFHVKRQEVGPQEVEPQEVEVIGALDQKGLRRRKGPVETPKPQSTESAAQKGHTDSLTQDPLRWFGVLVPQSLRQAQSTFREGILLAAEVASLQNSVDTTQREWRLLLAQKQELLAQTG
ncbi:coiled-coil domain-containing protein 115 [Xenopus laevis]|uniref:Vacuolar ATPase assembly protein VMA22 n=2 Tax=Xenopus laevis TaxID=8355 RepID=A0A1L8EZQ4_XENLA|nr:coiled-coil domain-containing protein 115 [Xenopus laevis]OCT64759.1 hypothetical protein XELAEV_18040997mg [Xenopus laevis]